MIIFIPCKLEFLEGKEDEEMGGEGEEEAG